jgi:hypothetical protein
MLLVHLLALDALLLVMHCCSVGSFDATLVHLLCSVRLTVNLDGLLLLVHLLCSVRLTVNNFLDGFIGI